MDLLVYVKPISRLHAPAFLLSNMHNVFARNELSWKLLDARLYYTFLKVIFILQPLLCSAMIIALYQQAPETSAKTGCSTVNTACSGTDGLREARTSPTTAVYSKLVYYTVIVTSARGILSA